MIQVYSNILENNVFMHDVPYYLFCLAIFYTVDRANIYIPSVPDGTTRVHNLHLLQCTRN